MSKKILIVLFGAIGDVTRALPLAVRIKRAWGEARISWAVEPLSRPLLEGHPAVDKLLVFDRPRGILGYRQFLRELQGDGPFDITLDLQRHLKSGFTAWRSGAAKRIGFHRRNSKEGNFLFQTACIPPVDNWSPKIGHYQLFGDALGLPPLEAFDFGLVPTAAESVKAEELLAPISHVPVFQRAAFILGSSWPSRFWFPKRYRELAKRLFNEHGVCSILVGAQGERAFADEVANGLPGEMVLDCVGKTSLRDLIALFRGTAFAIGSDSGPMHIAAACGIPVISLWGSTSPLRSAPYRSEDLVLQSAIGCSPCYRKTCPGLGRLCMSDIPAEAVVGRIDQLLASGRLNLKGTAR